MKAIRSRPGRRATRLCATLAALLCVSSVRAQPTPAPSDTPAPLAEGARPPEPARSPDQAPAADAYVTVVTATRAPEDARFVGSSISVVSEVQLQALQLRTVEDALRLVPGVDLARSGGPGAATSAFVRGANPGQTLVLVDGVDASDPSDPAGAANLADLGTDELERIEVLRGPASSLYGSSALGGVINLITRRGRGPLKAEARVEGGSFRTFGGWASVRGGGEAGHYALNVSRVGMGSLARAEGAPASSVNPYQRLVVAGRAGLTAFAPADTDLVLRFSDSTFALNTFREGRPVVDPNFTQSARQLLARPSVRIALLDDRWLQEASASLSWNARSTENLADGADPSTGNDTYRSLRLAADWQHDLKLGKGNRAMVVASARHESASTRSVQSSSWGAYESAFPKSSVQTFSLAVQDSQRILEALELRASGRLDAHEQFGNAWTYNLAASHEVARLRTQLRASWGTAFKAPTLLQLFDPTYGNSGLRPERSQSFEAGFAQPLLSRRLTLGAAWFRASVKDLMSFDPTTYRSLNAGSALLSGVESFVELKLGAVRVRLDDTWTRPIDRDTREDLVRRPRHKASLWADLRGPRELVVGAGVRYVGDRYDTDYAQATPARVTLSEYVVASAAVSFPLAEAVTLGARVENLFDARYQDILGYRAPGLGAFATLSLER